MAGSVFKRCGCKEILRDDNGVLLRDTAGRIRRRELGAACPKLRRRHGSWSPTHGTWWFLLEVPTPPGAKRRHLRQGGHSSDQQARNAMDAVVRLLDLAKLADDPATTRTRIADRVQSAIRAKKPLPDYDETRRRMRSTRPVDEVLTVAQWLHEWFTGKNDLRPTTRRSYESHLRLHLIPHLGHHRLDRLRVAHIQAMFIAIEERNDDITANNTHRRALQDAARSAWRTGDTHAARTARDRLAQLPPFAKPVGPATRQRIRATLRSALTDAAAQELITVNVAKLVKLTPAPKPRPRIWTRECVAAWRTTGTVPSPVMVWTPEQTARFLARAARTKHLYALFLLIAVTGLRRGEAVGVRWTDLDLGSQVPGRTGVGTLHISAQIVQLGWDTMVGAPKSDAGTRSVALAADTVHLLRVHRQRQNRRRDAAGDQWADTDYVFTDDTGLPLHPASVTALFRQLTREADLPPVRLHDLRHGAATHALTAGVDIKVVQDMLGHATSTLTRDTYTSVADEAKHAAAHAITALLNAAETTPTSPRPLPKLPLPTNQLPTAEPDSPYVRRINLDPRLGPDDGTGWELAAHRAAPGRWDVLHHGHTVATIERRVAANGQGTLGWHATRHGTPITLGANAKGLYRSRDLAAAAVIHLETELPDNVRPLRRA